MAKGGNTGKGGRDYRSDLEYFKSHAFAGWAVSASDLLENCDKVRGKCVDGIVNSYTQTISNYENDKADKGEGETKSLRGRVTDVETVLLGKMDKTKYQREDKIGKTNVTLQDCIDDAGNQIKELEKKLFPDAVSGKLGGFSPSVASGSLTGLSVGVTAMSFGVTGLELSLCGLCVMGAGLAAGCTGTDGTTHTASNAFRAFLYCISFGKWDTGVVEKDTEAETFDAAGVETTVATALTHVGPYLKL